MFLRTRTTFYLFSWKNFFDFPISQTIQNLVHCYSDRELLYEGRSKGINNFHYPLETSNYMSHL